MLELNKFDGRENEDVTPETLLKLADDMASAAVSFSAHGYDHFISARENFKNVSRQIFETYTRTK